MNALASGNDFSVQIEPGANIFVPLEREVTIDHFASDRQLSTCHTPDYRIGLNPQPVTLPPVYMVVINGAKMISGLVVEKADGRCLRESVSNSDTGTESSIVHCYTDYKR